MLADNHDPMPVRPQRCRVRMEEVDGDLELSYRRPTWGAGCFLLLWLTAWSAGCVMLVQKVLAEPTLFHVLFTVPFLASWFFVFFLLLYLFFGAERLRLGLGGLDYRSSALVTLGHRHVPLVEIKHIRRGLTSSRSRSDNPLGNWCIIVETRGAPLEFGGNMSEKEQHWLVAVLNRYLDVLRSGRPPAPDEGGANTTGAEKRGEAAGRSVVLRPSPVPLQPPSDSRARLRRDPEAVEFSWRGRWSLTAAGVASFLCLFWNGIVSVFVYLLFHQFQWFLCVFLIPFEVIGLVIFAAWFGTVTAPAWRRAWAFRGSEITRLYSGFGIGWAKRYEVDTLQRIELQRRAAGHEGAQELSPDVLRPGANYSLSFVRPDGTELLEVRALTEGEARWMADVLFRDFPGWFQSLPQAAREESGQ
jgi:hypothetical protein